MSSAETTTGEEVNFASPFEWSVFKKSYSTIYSNLTSINKIIFIIGVSFHAMRIIATVILLSIYFQTGSINGVVTAFLIWTLIAIVNLLFPLYFTIRQDHFEIRENILFERMKQSCHTTFDYPYFIIFVYQCCILFFQQQAIPGLLYYLLLINVILGFSYTFFPALLAVTAILCLPCIYIFVRDGRLREEARQRALGASQSIINSIPVYKFRKQGQPQVDIETGPAVVEQPKKKRFRLFSKPKQVTDTVQVQAKEWLEIEDGDANCSICLCEYEPGEEIRQLGCKHHYHVKCIDGWLTLNAVCPNCRGMDLVGSSSAALQVNSQAGSRNGSPRQSTEAIIPNGSESQPNPTGMEIPPPVITSSDQDLVHGDVGERSESDKDLIP